MKSKFRIFDAVIIIICIASILLFANKINLADGRKNVFEGEESATITIVVPYIETEIAEAIKKDAPLKDILQFKTLGKITDVKLEEVDDADFTFDGKTLGFDKSRYKRAIITVDAVGKRTEKGILIGQTNYLVGQSNTFSAGVVQLEEIRISGIKYSGE